MADYRAALEGSNKYLCSKCQSSLTELWTNRYKTNLSLFTSVGLVLKNSAQCSLCRLGAHCLGLEKFEIPSSVLQNIDLPDAKISLDFLLPPRVPHNDLIRPITISFKLSISSNSIFYNRTSPSYIKIRSDDLGHLGLSEDFGGRPPAPTQTQIPLVKKWLAHCSEEHGPSCDISPFPSSRSKPLMVVDVKHGCLMDLPPSPSRRYFALSYVWGQAATFETVLDNVDCLRKRGGINAIRHLLPKTITDAMELLIALDEQYLWCDRLCIIQDDAENKHSLIARMDEVYATAFAVILARSGLNAEAGLFAERHPWHTEERISDSLRFVAIPIPECEDEYDMAPLERRGWTFQEKLLARRQLIFSHGLVTFQCGRAKYSAAFSERPIPACPLPPETEFTDKKPPLDGSHRALRSWCSSYYDLSLREYTGRALSFPSDSLNAFQGILQCLSTLLRSEIYYGLPTTFFDGAILWTAKSFESVCCDTFPTWCWAAWSGVKNSDTSNKYHRYWIIWYCDDINEGITRPLQRMAQHRSDDEPNAGNTVVLDQNAESHNITRIAVEDHLYYSPDGECIAIDTWPSRLQPEFQRYCRSQAILQRQISWPPQTPTSTHISLKAGTLRFYTLCASFEVSPCEEQYYSTHVQLPDASTGRFKDDSYYMYYVLRDKYGIPCGAFYLDTDRAICPDNLRGKQDLVVLAESAEHLDVHDVIKEQTYIERLKDTTGIECAPAGEDQFRMFDAIVVQWVDGVAYRKSSRVVCVTRVAMGYALGEGAVWREVALR